MITASIFIVKFKVSPDDIFSFNWFTSADRQRMTLENPVVSNYGALDAFNQGIINI